MFNFCRETLIPKYSDNKRSIYLYIDDVNKNILLIKFKLGSFSPLDK